MDAITAARPAAGPRAGLSGDPTVYVVIVNWNSWADTVECLESLLRLDYGDLRVVVCDNASTDGSLERLADWAEGRLDVVSRGDPALRRLVTPPLPKPVDHEVLDRAAAEAGHGGGARVTLVRNGANLGFSAGCNVGLRHALARGDAAYAWLLNADTVVPPDSLRALVETMRRRPRVGMCGSKLVFYDRPDTVQALGGARMLRCFATCRDIGTGTPASAPVDAAEVERQMDLIIGASMLVSREFLEEVGLMHEPYFLYFEEADWAERARGRFEMAFAPGSVVYHKEASTTGVSRRRANFGGAADFYLLRGRLLFARRHARLWLVTVAARLLGTLASSILLGRWKRVRMMASLEFWAKDGPRRA